MTASGDPVVTAKAFVGAVAWGEHTTVWDLLAPDARIAVLEVATRRGMDPLLAARLREGTAGDDERDGFLAVGRRYGVSDNAIRKWLLFFEREQARANDSSMPTLADIRRKYGRRKAA